MPAVNQPAFSSATCSNTKACVWCMHGLAYNFAYQWRRKRGGGRRRRRRRMKRGRQAHTTDVVTRVCTQRETSTKFLKASQRRDVIPRRVVSSLSIQVNWTYLRPRPGAYLRKYRYCSSGEPREIDLPSDRCGRYSGSGWNFANKARPLRRRRDRLNVSWYGIEQPRLNTKQLDGSLYVTLCRYYHCSWLSVYVETVVVWI